MKINNLKNRKTIELVEVQAGDVFEVYDKFYIKTNERTAGSIQSYIICVDLIEGSFAYFKNRQPVSIVEATLNISNIIK